MAYYPEYDLTLKTPAATFAELVEYNKESSSFVTGDGYSILSSINITTSNAISASWSPPYGTTVGLSGTQSWASVGNWNTTISMSMYILNGLIVSWSAIIN